MTTVVVDASVVVKWYVPEALWQSAVLLMDEEHDLHVPDLLFSEVGNVLWKKALRGEISPTEAPDILSQLRLVPLTIHPGDDLVEQAFPIALSTRRSVYDCMYVALACRLDAVVATADRRLVEALSCTGWASRVGWIGQEGFLW